MGDNAGMTEQTCATPSSMRPRIALYSHDTMGLGHIRRNTLIAQTLIQPPLSAQVLLVSGIRESGAFALPPGIQLRSEERRVGKECRSRWSPYH